MSPFARGCASKTFAAPQLGFSLGRGLQEQIFKYGHTVIEYAGSGNRGPILKMRQNECTA